MTQAIRQAIFHPLADVFGSTINVTIADASEGRCRAAAVRSVGIPNPFKVSGLTGPLSLRVKEATNSYKDKTGGVYLEFGSTAGMYVFHDQYSGVTLAAVVGRKPKLKNAFLKKWRGLSAELNRVSQQYRVTRLFLYDEDLQAWSTIGKPSVSLKAIAQRCHDEDLESILQNYQNGVECA